MSYWPPCFRGSAPPSSTTAAQKLRARPSHAAAARAAKSPARLACPARHCWSSRWRMSVRETTLRREVSGPAARSAQARAAHRRRQAVCCFCRAPGRPRFWRGTNALSPPWARPAAGQASAGLASPVRACPMCRPVPSCQRRHRFARVYRNLVTRARILLGSRQREPRVGREGGSLALRQYGRALPLLAGRPRLLPAAVLGRCRAAGGRRPEWCAALERAAPFDGGCDCACGRDSLLPARVRRSLPGSPSAWRAG